MSPVNANLYFGGSFNPIHHGHLICARAVAEALGYATVTLVPTGQAPHKAVAADMASSRDRLTMCQRAVAGDPLFAVSDIEVLHNGPSYTILTARALKQRGEGEVHWLIGADMVRILPQWHLANQLIDEVKFILMARPGWSFDWESLPGKFQKLKANVVEAPLIDISATQIRQRVRQGRSIEYLAPRPVIDYIKERGLYRAT